MGLRMKITPPFRAREIYDIAIKKNWFEFQLGIFEIGKLAHSYMQNFINTNRKRQGGTGNLSKDITFEPKTGAGTVFVGVGNTDILNSRAPYWYVTNYGKKITGEPFVPGGGKVRPIDFGGSPPEASLRGRGTEKVTGVKRITGQEPVPSIVRPMHYIQATQHRVNADLRNLLRRIKGLSTSK